MDSINAELHIPKRQLREVKSTCNNRFEAIVPKEWIKSLVQQGRLLPNVPEIAKNLFEWPTNESNGLESSWQKVHLTVYYKHPHRKVLPLPKSKEHEKKNQMPMTFSQLMRYTNTTNFKSLWKSAYHKYSGARNIYQQQQDAQRGNSSDISNFKLVSYDSALREVILRTYRCPIVQKYGPTASSSSAATPQPTTTENAKEEPDAHENLDPAVVVVETTTCFLIVHDYCIENTLLDCITFSPAILDNYNKSLFLIYQLLNLVKSFHDSGLLLGVINLFDIHLTENLWLQVFPNLTANLIELPEELQKPAVFKLTLPKELGTDYRVDEYCEMWVYGFLSNYDYLMILNKLAGRTMDSHANHPVMPWVSDFTSRNGLVWRDLTKSKYRINKGDTQLDFTFQVSLTSTPHHVSDVLSDITYYVYTARRTPKEVLQKHVRPVWVPSEYPNSIQRLQEWTPDECIPEFFSDPSVFRSIHEDMPDLEVPTAWSTCPEDFIAKHREMLESRHVSEKLHHWIDLTFGFKLSGMAAVKSKNVCLPLVDGHQELCKRGVVQLFFSHHPAKQFPTPWCGKNPPRIRASGENRKRMTRSTEDLSHRANDDLEISTTTVHNSSATSTSTRQSRLSSQQSECLGRSPSCHANVARSSVALPKNFNPIAQLEALENFHAFRVKTFAYRNQTSTATAPLTAENLTTTNTPQSTSSPLQNPSVTTHKVTMPILPNADEEEETAFTNRVFSERFEPKPAPQPKKELEISRDRKTFKDILTENRAKDLEVLGVIIMEIFKSNKMRAHGSVLGMSYDKRIEVCRRLLFEDFQHIPPCVQYPLKLLFELVEAHQHPEIPQITDLGFPLPTADQLLEPILFNFLFPFPIPYIKVYAAIKALYQFRQTQRLLDIYTYFDCDGHHCQRYENIDKTRIACSRKIAECKVKACVKMVENLLEPSPKESYQPIELLLPHIIDLVNDEETSILAAWYLFDMTATALGPKAARKYLLEPIVQLYESDSQDRVHFLHANDPGQQFASNSSFRKTKQVKLYHHSFLLKLVVRFGLKCFLDNFVPSLIEAVGGIKDMQGNQPYHTHTKPIQCGGGEFQRSRSMRNIKLNETDKSESNTLISPVAQTSDKTLSPDELNLEEGAVGGAPAATSEEGVFVFEEQNSDETRHALKKILDQYEIRSETGSLDLKLNYSAAFEVSEDEHVFEQMSNEDESQEMRAGVDDPNPTNEGVTSPTIPIPSTFHRTFQVDSITCDIGSRKSVDSIDIFAQTMNAADDKPTEKPINRSMMDTSICSNKSDRASSRSSRISDMSMESVLWLSHRLGPVLTARYLSRNLLKMLTLCYVGHENLLPDDTFDYDDPNTRINSFTVAESRVIGDIAAANVLDSLCSIAALFGEQFIVLQYLPHLSELIALCRKKLTLSLEGGLISALQMIKFLISCLSDTQLMEQLQDVILQSILHPIIRLLGSEMVTMPSGYLARSVLARKLIDVLYAISVRIGPERTNSMLCVPTLQKFFLIFDKAFGQGREESRTDDERQEESGVLSPGEDESNFLEIRRDGSTKEWTVKEGEIRSSATDIRPVIESVRKLDINDLRSKALDEIKDVFTPNLAFIAYTTFLKYLGEYIMSRTIENLSLITSLCLEHEQPDYTQMMNDRSKFESTTVTQEEEDDSNAPIGSFSSNIAVVGNRIDVQSDSTSMGLGEVINLVAYRFDNINTSRHLKGNWLAYWEHEIGRSEKDNRFNLKQIKLQTFTGHNNSVRSLICLDNENSFMSASKDKTVKLWSLRSEGDGSRISPCQFTYTNHKKSIISLSFLESLRLTVSCDSGVHIWDPFVGSQVGYFDNPKFSPVTVVQSLGAPSTVVLAGTSDGMLKMIDARSFEYINSWKLTNTVGSSVRCIAVSPSGNWIATGLNSGQLVLLDARTGYILSTTKQADTELLRLLALNDNQFISTSLDHHVSVWGSKNGDMLYQLKSPPEPAHCVLNFGSELIIGTAANRIGNYPTIGMDAPGSFTKLRSEIFKGVLTSMSILPLNRLMLIGSDNGNITLLC